MAEYRVAEHPILPIEPRESVVFYWQGRKLIAKQGETIASALFANGVRTFGHHSKDGAPQGIFCANGQCAQCLVLAGSTPVKSCMELVRPGLQVEPVNGLPELPRVARVPQMRDIEEIAVPVLIIGGGPAGLSAAIELGKLGIEALLVDDKHRLGGKLVLQTHRFFGSTNAVYAGTRGIDIATKLESQVRSFDTIRIWLNSTALAVFSDQKVGLLRDGERYVLVTPQVLLVAAGAREKSLAFKGNTLPGVYGAGAFQTLVNRDLVKAAEKLFIVGGGNVGLIAGYHALQAGISVVGLVEAMPECGGYKVHKDKLTRLGVPIYTSHTVVSANGEETAESVTVAQVNERFQPIPGTERSFECDTVLIAVGLDPVNEFYVKAKESGMAAFAAGDTEEIAEASAAMFSGKIKGLEIARALGCAVGEIPSDWYHTAKILKSKPGRTVKEHLPDAETGVVPVFHCSQEIPCDPCTAVCPQGAIYIDEADIRQIPIFIGEHLGKACLGCEKCVTICPGLAITLVDYRKDVEHPTVAIAYEFLRQSVHVGDVVIVLDAEGTVLGNVAVTGVRALKAHDRTVVVKLQAPREYAKRIGGIRVQEEQVTRPMDHYVQRITDDTIVCRCERVTAAEIRALIGQGYRDINEIKAVSRAGLGACGAKTCTPLIHRLFRDEGIPEAEVTDNVRRPLFMEVPLGVFAGAMEKE
jgi:NADPH-dependent 2,4-dienoyl-CoA reductase/sulfur reductase-like enzyme/NAD-dependent dihydropyrimidine dehydrogenase PreA subunit/bacterioferritin-associated ferredoxin